MRKRIAVTSSVLFCLALLASHPARSAVSGVTLINPFVVQKGFLKQAIAMWDIARDFLKEQPGYISTKLHQSLAADASYQLINVAQWESAALFKQAVGKMRKADILPRIEGVSGAPQLYAVVRD